VKTTTHLFSFFFCLIILSTTLIVNAQPSIAINVSPTKQSYNRCDVVTVGGELLFANQPVNGLVGITMVNAQGDVIVMRTVSAGTVSNPLGSITSACLSDQLGNKLTSATTGQLVSFTINVINNDSETKDLCAVVSVYDNNGVPVSYASTKFYTVSSGAERSATLSFIIPSGAAGGPAYAYVGLYSNWPIQGGYPLAPETSIPFTLIGTKQGSNQPSTSHGNQGSYELSFKLPSRAVLGQTTVYVASSINGLMASGMTLFTVKQLGDFNGDGILDFRDTMFLVENWLAYYKGQPWNPIVDLNNDSFLDFEDLLLYTNAYIQYHNGVV
jgi:uncharacterized OB-fold protein